MLKAMELGINFIVIIVIAVVILGLGITWVQNVFGNIGVLSDQSIQLARQDLIKRLGNEGKSIGITLLDQDNDGKIPISRSGAQQVTTRPKVIIKNSDSDTRCYKLGIDIVRVDSSVASAAGFQGCINEDCKSNWDALKAKLDTKNWFGPPAFVQVGAGIYEEPEAIVDINNDAPLGEYSFEVKAESVKKSIGDCRGHDYTDLGANEYKTDSEFFIINLVA